MASLPDPQPGTRQRLLHEGARVAKAHGFAASGMDTLAAAAGVTTGSLYKHFSGKADLFAALLAAELQRSNERLAAIDDGDTARFLRAQARYLAPAHVQQPADGCPLPALAAEVARADDTTRQVFEHGLREAHAQMQRFTRSPADAWALLAQNVGAVLLARAVADPALQRELLAAARQQLARLVPAPDSSPAQDLR